MLLVCLMVEVNSLSNNRLIERIEATKGLDTKDVKYAYIC